MAAEFSRRRRFPTIFSTFFLLPLVLLLLLLVSPSAGQQQADCSGLTFSQGRTFALCNPLPRLGASLHWTYTQPTRTVRLAYRARHGNNGWVAWALNPTARGMLGAQALVAVFNGSTGSFTAYSTSIQNMNPSMAPGPLSFPVADGPTAEFASGFVTIFATVTLPDNRTSINHVWQASDAVQNGAPGAHPFSGDNLQSLGTIDFLSGQASGGGGGSRLRRRNAHGVLNAVSWGVLMPMGAIMARYLRVFESADPAWFYLHIACQCSAYVVGVAGWATGLKLGSESAGIKYTTHRNLGITLFTFATLQVFALLLRPKKDHKYRIFWNVYHHSIGYSILVMSAINIFKGFDILRPANGWKRAYIGILIGLGAVALVLEAATWAVVIKRRQRSSADKVASGGRGASNNYGVPPRDV